MIISRPSCYHSTISTSAAIQQQLWPLVFVVWMFKHGCSSRRTRSTSGSSGLAVAAALVVVGGGGAGVAVAVAVGSAGVRGAAVAMIEGVGA